MGDAVGGRFSAYSLYMCRRSRLNDAGRELHTVSQRSSRTLSGSGPTTRPVLVKFTILSAA
jgi:hypothetical protein